MSDGLAQDEINRITEVILGENEADIITKTTYEIHPTVEDVYEYHDEAGFLRVLFAWLYSRWEYDTRISWGQARDVVALALLVDDRVEQLQFEEVSSLEEE